MTRISDTPRTPIEQLKWAAFRLSTAPPSAAIEAQATFDSALESVERELRAYRKEGWVLVPREPTPEMLAAVDRLGNPWTLAEAYRTLIGVASSTHKITECGPDCIAAAPRATGG